MSDSFIPAATRTWVILIGLTLIAMWNGAGPGAHPLGLITLVTVVAVSGFKAAAILRDFLELRRAARGWQLLLYGYLAILGTFIMAAYAVPWASLRVGA